MILKRKASDPGAQLERPPSGTSRWFLRVMTILSLSAMAVAAPRLGSHEGYSRLVFPLPASTTAVLKVTGQTATNDPRAQLLAKLGRPEANPKAYQAISPNAFLADLKGRPIQIHHATGDTHVPFSFSLALAKGLRAVKQPHTLYSYENDDHDLSRNLGTALARSVAFFKTYL